MPYEFVPPSVDAFRMDYNRAKTELGGLTDEDRADMLVQSVLEEAEAHQTGRRPTSPLSSAFEVVRRKRSGKEPRWGAGVTTAMVLEMAEKFLAERRSAAKVEEVEETPLVSAEKEQAIRSRQPGRHEQLEDAALIATGFSALRYQQEIDGRIARLQTLLDKHSQRDESAT